MSDRPTPEFSADEPLQPADVVGMGTIMLLYEALVPQVGGKQKLHSQGLEVVPGGAAAVALTQLARLGVTAGWLGVMGDDEDGDTLINHLGREGIETRCVKRLGGKRSPFAWVMVAPDGSRSTLFFPNVLSDLTPEQVSATMVGCIDNALHFHTDVATIPLRTTLQAIEVARAADCMIFTDLDTDPVYLVDEVGLGRHKELEVIMERTDVLKLCRSAAARLTGQEDPQEACRIIHGKYGSRYTLVTADRDGSSLAYLDQEWYIPPLGGPVVDTTGAGGAYFGGVSYAILAGQEGADVGYFASACAAAACSRVGSLALGSMEEIQSIMSGEGVTEEADLPGGSTAG
ncbi:MAG: carbohydrate kinase family protein [bacterium]